MTSIQWIEAWQDRRDSTLGTPPVIVGVCCFMLPATPSPEQLHGDEPLALDPHADALL